VSIEQAKAFFEKMKTDEAFHNRVIAIEDAKARVAFINNEGFTCTLFEIKDVSGELSDEDLDYAAGGRQSKIVWEL